jgi:hypothetical protein
MPFEKLKNESYTQFGGINSKSSPYATSPLEFLDIINFDFQTPGSLTQRWGSTQYVTQTFAGPITALTEYSKLSGASYVVVGVTGALFYGATTGTSANMTLTPMNATFAVSTYQIFYPVIVIIPASTKQLSTVQTGAGYLGSTQQLVQSYTLTLSAEVTGQNKISSVTFNDYLFMADGSKFLKFDGTNVTRVGLPFPTICGVVNQGPTFAADNLTSSTYTIGYGVTGYYGVYFSYVNTRGFESPIWPIMAVNKDFLNGTTMQAVTAGGGTYLVVNMNVNTPIGFGISAINVYHYWSSASFLPTTAGFWTNPYVFTGSYPASGSSITNIYLGSTTGGQSNLVGNIGNFPSNPSYFPLGGSLSSTNAAALGLNSNSLSELDLTNYYPQYLELYQNRLFSAGYSTTPSFVWFSDAGEPEGYFTDSNFEVRTNDSDSITALKSYGSALFIFKSKSFHILNGDNPNNFFLSQVSDQYGCVNNRSVITYESSMAFLDKKGVILYNGANLQHLSLKVQSVFDSVNYIAAQDNACMVHDKLRNQIMVALPINGATLNNITMVYDYVLDAWTKQDGYNPTVFARIQGRNNTKNVFYGTSSGLVNWFGSSFLSDNGTGFTCYMKTRFLHDLGESYQKQFRRLYLNIDATGGYHWFSR